MPFQITILETDISGFPPSVSAGPYRFVAFYNPFWVPERFGRREHYLRAGGNTKEEAVANLKEVLKEFMKREKVLEIDELTLFESELK